MRALEKGREEEEGAAGRVLFQKGLSGETQGVGLLALEWARKMGACPTAWLLAEVTTVVDCCFDQLIFFLSRRNEAILFFAVQGEICLLYSLPDAGAGWKSWWDNKHPAELFQGRKLKLETVGLNKII